MSELKVYHCNEWHNEYTEFYLKSEADKVIAELEESHKMEVGQLWIEIANLKKACNDKDDWCWHTLKENRHHKYKRCMAKAQWCDAEADVADADGDYEDMRWYQKWHKRWLTIAEKFKTNSTINRKEDPNAL